MPAKGVLLDRDGTLIRHVPYLGDPAQVVLADRAAPALQRLHRAGYLLIVVTNQSGIGRGLFSEEDFAAVQRRLDELLRAEGVPIRAVYHCPHHPTEARGDYRRDCDCRKPEPGMLARAIREHDLDRARTFMVGDAPCDVQAGRAAGVRTVRLRGGEGDADGDAQADWVADDLWDAVVRCIGV